MMVTATTGGHLHHSTGHYRFQNVSEPELVSISPQKRAESGKETTSSALSNRLVVVLFTRRGTASEGNGRTSYYRTILPLNTFLDPNERNVENACRLVGMGNGPRRHCISSSIGLVLPRAAVSR